MQTQLPPFFVSSCIWTSSDTTSHTESGDAANTGFASGGVTCKLEALCFESSVVQVDSFVLRNPPERKARKRCHTFEQNIMQKNKTLFIIILILIANINKSIGQELVIDEMYRIQVLIQMENYDSAIEFTKKLNDSLKCEKNEILGFSYGKLGEHELAAQYYENYI